MGWVRGGVRGEGVGSRTRRGSAPLHSWVGHGSLTHFRTQLVSGPKRQAIVEQQIAFRQKRVTCKADCAGSGQDILRVRRRTDREISPPREMRGRLKNSSASPGNGPQCKACTASSAGLWYRLAGRDRYIHVVSYHLTQNTFVMCLRCSKQARARRDCPKGGNDLPGSGIALEGGRTR